MHILIYMFNFTYPFTLGQAVEVIIFSSSWHAVLGIVV